MCQPSDDPATLVQRSCFRFKRMRGAAQMPVDNLPLVYLRIAVGIAIYVWAGDFLEDDKYQQIFMEPRFLFKYPHFEWVKLWPGEGIYWHFIVAKIAASGLVLGLLTRTSGLIASFCIAYVLLVESRIYVNHYYLLACVAFLLACLPSGARLSVDGWLSTMKIPVLQTKARAFAAWQLWLVRFHLGIPYFFGAVAKLNGDWLRGQPAELILRSQTNLFGLGAWDELSEAMQDTLVSTMAYGGFIYDLLIVPMLLWKRTRWMGVLLSLLFHLTNSATLQIGVFPWFMLATILVFFPPAWFTRRWAIILGRPEQITLSKAEREAALLRFERPLHRLGRKAACILAVVHCLLPLRPMFYRGDANWNELGQRYAWRMMLRYKTGMVHFRVEDIENDAFLFVPSETVLTGYQQMRADLHPELIRQTAAQIALAAQDLGVENCRVFALALVSLNGRKPALMIKPDVDLNALPADAALEEWLIDEPGPMLHPPWLVPQEDWWREIALPEPFVALQGRRPTELREYLQSINASGN